MTRSFASTLGAIMVALLLIAAGCGSSDTDASQTDLAEQPTTSSGSTATPDATDDGDAAATPTAVPEATATEEPEATAEPVATPTTEPTATPEPAPTATAAPTATPAPVLPLTIASDGIGGVTFGDSQAEITAALGASYTITPADDRLVDLRGWAISLDGEELFLALHVVGEPDEVVVFISYSDQVETSDGVHAGSTVGDVQTSHGDPQFSYNTNSESREFVVFADGLGLATSGLQLQSRGPGGDLAGIYATNDEFNETIIFQNGSIIYAVWLFDR